MPTLKDYMMPMASHIQSPPGAPGLLFEGTLDPRTQKPAINPDGSISTVRTIGIDVDGWEVLIPTISPDGKFLTDDEAIEQYKRTGRHLGVFDSQRNADRYAQVLHEAEAQRIGPVMRPMASHMTMADAFGMKK